MESSRKEVSHQSARNERGVAIVTGGAGSIGTVICYALARDGMRVVVGYNRSAEKARALAANLPGEGHAALAAPVTDSGALTTLAAEIAGRYGVCDVLVNCAGTTRFVPHGDLEGLDDSLIDSILSTNVRGPFAAVRALRPLLEKSKQTGGAVVVNISSIAAVTAMGSNVIYCASKAAVDNMTKSLARALAPRIRVVSVSPGVVDNDFIRSMDPRWLEEQVSRTPLKRLSAPDEVAGAVVAAIKYLTFTTGSIIPVDGGRPLS
jgi:3-oxoacyl-[acyl-carrier protein] reductase